MNNRAFALWFMAVGIPGAIMETGLQSQLHLSLGYCMAAIVFVVVLAAAVAESMEHLANKREEEREIDNALANLDAVDWSGITEQIDQDLNGPKS